MYYGPAMRGDQMAQLPSGMPMGPMETPKGTDVGSLWSTFVRRRRVFYSVFVAFLGLVILFTLLTPKTYATSVRMIAGNSSPISTQSADTAYPLMNALLFNSGAQSSETYAELLQETPVATQVVRDLHLPIDAKSLVQGHISVKPVNNTQILSLSATWTDPQTSAKIANDFASVFVLRERDLVSRQAGSALDFLSKQIPVAEAKMHSADNALSAFATKHGIADINAQTQGSISNLQTLETKVAQTEVDRQQAEAQLASVSGQLGTVSATVNGSSSINQNPVVAQLQTQLAQVTVQLDSARKQYTNEHPTVLALQEQKAQLEREIRNQPATIVAGNSIVPNPVYQQLSQQAATLRAQIAGDSAQLGTLNSQLAPANGSVRGLPAQTVQLANLQRTAKLAEGVYAALQQKYSDATVAKTAALSDVAVTQDATPGSADVRPSWVMNIALGVILGLVLALSGVFIVDFFDNTFKDEQDVQRALPLPLLTTVPELTAKSPAKLPWLRALTIESFLQLVTALRYSSDKPLRTLTITSPNQGDGKSTVAMSTAIAMAEMDPSVVLVDADLRRPTLHERLGVENVPGLSEYLIGAREAADIVRPTKYEGLYLITSGAHVPNPMKLLESSRFDQLVTELLKEHRAIVFDTPALLPVYDAAALSAKTDGAVLVVSAGLTNMPSTKKALQRLSAVPGVNMVGIVLNRVTPSNGYGAYYLNGDSPLPLPHELESV